MFKSTLTRLCATHHSYSLPRQIKPRGLRSYSEPPNHVGDAVPTVATSWIKRRQSLSPPADVCFSTGRLNHLSRFHRWVDLALLFKKGVGREIAVLEVADNVFANVQHSRNPLLRTCGRRNAGDLSQSTFCACVENFFLEAPPLQPESDATLLQLCGCRRRKLRSRSSHERFLRDLLPSVASKKNNVSKQAYEIFKSSCTQFAPLGKAR